MGNYSPTGPRKNSNKNPLAAKPKTAATSQTPSVILPPNLFLMPKRKLWPVGWMPEVLRLLGRNLKYHPLLFAGSLCIALSWIIENVVTESNRDKSLYISHQLSELWRIQSETEQYHWRRINLDLFDTSIIRLTRIEFNAKALQEASGELGCYYGLWQTAKKIRYGEDSNQAADNEYRDSTFNEKRLNKDENFKAISALLLDNQDRYLNTENEITVFAATRIHELQVENEHIRTGFIWAVIIGTALIQLNNAREREENNLKQEYLINLVQNSSKPADATKQTPP